MEYSQLKSDILEKFLEVIEKSSLVYKFTSFNIRRSLFGGFCFYQIDKSSFFYSNVVFTFKIKKDKLLIKCKDIVLSNKLQIYPTNKKLEIDLPKSSEEFVNFYSFELPRLILGNYSDVDSNNLGGTLFDAYLIDYNMQQEAKNFWRFFYRAFSPMIRVPNSIVNDGVFIDNSNQNISKFELMAESQKRTLELLRKMKKEEEKCKLESLEGEVIF